MPNEHQNEVSSMCESRMYKYYKPKHASKLIDDWPVLDSIRAYSHKKPRSAKQMININDMTTPRFSHEKFNVWNVWAKKTRTRPKLSSFAKDHLKVPTLNLRRARSSNKKEQKLSKMASVKKKYKSGCPKTSLLLNKSWSSQQPESPGVIMDFSNLC